MASHGSLGRIALIGVAVVGAAVTAAVAVAQPSSPRTPVMTRTLAWPGGDRLVVGLGADVRYVQGPNAKVVVTGPLRDIEHIVVDHGVIHQDRGGWNWGWWSWDAWRPANSVHIVVTAPHVEDVGVSGSGHLDLGRLAQERLELGLSGSGAADVSGRFKSLGVSVSGSGDARLGQVDVGDMSARISGSGWIRGAGTTSSLHLSISGSGTADLGGVVVQDVTGHISGSGSARLSPKRSADLAVAGSGSIRLLTQPARLSSHRAGSGSIISPQGSS